MAEFKHEEKEFIFDKKKVCPVCEKNFTTKVLKSSKARRIGSDDDLRPRFEDIDTIKYGICSCPNCGYSASHNIFDNITNVHKKLIRNNVAAMFKPVDRSSMEIYDYNTAVIIHKMAYMCAAIKGERYGEQGYYSLLLAWLYRAMGENAKTEREKKKHKEDEERFYAEANTLLSKAAMTETPPIMGLSQASLDYLLGYMAFHFGSLDQALRYVGAVLPATVNAPQSLKDKALELKEKIQAKRSVS